MTGLEIVNLVNKYIGVSADGYLGDFSYRTHKEFVSVHESRVTSVQINIDTRKCQPGCLAVEWSKVAGRSIWAAGAAFKRRIPAPVSRVFRATISARSTLGMRAGAI
jgi:hypothetical protein